MFWGHLEGIRVARLCSFVSPPMPCGNSECSLDVLEREPFPKQQEALVLEPALLTRGEDSGLVPAIPTRSLRMWRDGTPCGVATCYTKSPGMFKALWEKRRETSISGSVTLHRRQTLSLHSTLMTKAYVHCA